MKRFKPIKEREGIDYTQLVANTMTQEQALTYARALVKKIQTDESPTQCRQLAAALTMYFAEKELKNVV